MNNNNLMQLLSNLEGLTPAGLEHLMETQDRVVPNKPPTKLVETLTDQDVLSNPDD